MRHWWWFALGDLVGFMKEKGFCDGRAASLSWLTLTLWKRSRQKWTQKETQRSVKRRRSVNDANKLIALVTSLTQQQSIQNFSGVLFGILATIFSSLDVGSIFYRGLDLRDSWGIPQHGLIQFSDGCNNIALVPWIDSCGASRDAFDGSLKWPFPSNWTGWIGYVFL